jgi:WD40 repeat protein
MVPASARNLLILTVGLVPAFAIAQQPREQEIPASLEAALKRAAAPSPLDKLDPTAIPSLERFDWQPKELVAVLGEHRGRQGSIAQSVAYSPDGKMVASGGGDGRIRIWDRVTMRQRHLLGTSVGVARIAFFADGKTMAACTAGATVQLWDMTGKEPKATTTLQKGSTPYYALAVSHDGKYVVAGGADTAVRVWALEEGIRSRAGVDGKGPAGSGRESVTAKLLAEHIKHTGPVTGLAFAPDGKSFASSSSDGTIRLWAISGDKVLDRTVLQGHKGGVTCVAYSESGTLASGGSDGTVRLWNLAASPPREKTIITIGPSSVTALAFGPKGSGVLAAGHGDYTVRVWTLGNTPRQKSLLEGHGGHIYDVAFAPAKSRISEIATASADWTVRLWPGSGPKPRDKFIRHGHWSHTYMVDFGPEGKRLVSGSYDTSLRMWDLNGKAPKEQLVWKKDPVQTYALAFSPDGTGVAYGGSDTTVRLWEPDKRWIARKFVGHPGQVGAVAYSPDGKKLLTCSLNTIRLFDVSSGKAEREMKHIKAVNAIAFSPDGRYALSGAGAYEYKNNQILVEKGRYVYADCTTRLWDLDNGKELFRIKDQEVPVLSVAFRPDGRRIGYGIQDTYGVQEPVIRFYDLVDNKPGKMTKLQDRTYGYGYWLRYSPDGKTLVTVGINGKVILWDAATGRQLRDWTFNEVTYRAVYAPDSRHLAIPLGTGVVYVLRLGQK